MIIRVAENKDVEQIVDLLVAVFPRHPRTCDHWEWSHADGRGLSVVAELDGRIVGHYSFGFQEFWINGRRLTAGFGRQAAVHPAHRNLRTIVELTRFAEENAARKCAFVFAFPNANMAPVNERVLGWRRSVTFPTWTLAFPSFRAGLANRLAEAGGNSYDIRRLNTFADLNCRDATETAPDALTPFNDADWLEWRYARHPMKHYVILGAFDGAEFVGFSVLKTYLDDEKWLGHIVELHSRAADTAAKPALLAAAADWFEFNGVDEVVIWNEYRPNHALFEELGFMPSATSTSLYAKPLNGCVKDADLRNWSFDMGVSDIF